MNFWTIFLAVVAGGAAVSMIFALLKPVVRMALRTMIPGVKKTVKTLDVSSMHPTSICSEYTFGRRYSNKFEDTLYPKKQVKTTEQRISEKVHEMICEEAHADNLIASMRDTFREASTIKRDLSDMYEKCQRLMAEMDMAYENLEYEKEIKE